MTNGNTNSNQAQVLSRLSLYTGKAEAKERESVQHVSEMRPPCTGSQEETQDKRTQQHPSSPEAAAAAAAHSVFTETPSSSLMRGKWEIHYKKKHSSRTLALCQLRRSATHIQGKP